jgi:hypothetical protein
VVEQLGGLPEVEPGEEGGPVRPLHEGVLGEAFLDPLEGRLGRAGVEPRDEAEGEEVLRPVGVARLHTKRRDRLLGEARHRHLDQAVAGQAVVVERVGGVAGLGQVPFVERVDVDDQRAAPPELVEFGPQGGRVHGHQHVRRVTRCGDVVVGNGDLERRHAGDGARRRPDLGRELGQRRQVIAEKCAHGGEPIAGELHAVAGVAGEAQHHPVQFLRVGARCCVCHSPPSPRCRIESLCPSSTVHRVARFS